MSREGTLKSPNQCSFEENQCIGISRGSRSTKIHAVVDGLGNPVHVLLSKGNTHDVTVAEELLKQISISRSTVPADKAYEKWAFREYLADFCIPPKKNDTAP